MSKRVTEWKEGEKHRLADLGPLVDKCQMRGRVMTVGAMLDELEGKVRAFGEQMGLMPVNTARFTRYNGVQLRQFREEVMALVIGLRMLQASSDPVWNAGKKMWIEKSLRSSDMAVALLSCLPDPTGRTQFVKLCTKHSLQKDLAFAIHPECRAERLGENAFRLSLDKIVVEISADEMVSRPGSLHLLQAGMLEHMTLNLFLLDTFFAGDAQKPCDGFVKEMIKLHKYHKSLVVRNPGHLDMALEDYKSAMEKAGDDELYEKSLRVDGIEYSLPMGGIKRQNCLMSFRIREPYMGFVSVPSELVRTLTFDPQIPLSTRAFLRELDVNDALFGSQDGRHHANASYAKTCWPAQQMQNEQLFSYECLLSDRSYLQSCGSTFAIGDTALNITCTEQTPGFVLGHMPVTDRYVEAFATFRKFFVFNELYSSCLVEKRPVGVDFNVVPLSVRTKTDSFCTLELSFPKKVPIRISLKREDAGPTINVALLGGDVDDHLQQLQALLSETHDIPRALDRLNSESITIEGFVALLPDR